MNRQHGTSQIAEIIELAEGLGSCNRHLEEAYKNSRNPDLSDEERADFRDYAWEHLDESFYIFSRMREMPPIALLTCINILEHDLDDVGFPKTEEERRMYEATDAMKSCLQKIFEESG